VLGSETVCASGPEEVRAGWYPVGAAGTLLVLALAATLLASSPGTRATLESGTTSDRDVPGHYATLPVSFIPNRGQVDGQVRYYAQGGEYSFSFRDNKAVISLSKGKHGQSLALTFIDANPNPTIEPLARAPGEVNYLTGQVRQTHIPTYQVLAYRDLWPGIDMVFKGRGGGLVYEFLVAPGADPSKIRLAWQGASGLTLLRSGALEIKTPHGALIDARPKSYQRIGGRRMPVQSAFALDRGAANSYGFSLGTYDRSKPLVIDPSLQYSTYLGGPAGTSGTTLPWTVTGASTSPVGPSRPTFRPLPVRSTQPAAVATLS
jgi:hypothetical protein